jgi:hypothetical protein
VAVIAVGAGLAALALSVDGGRPRIAGIVALGAIRIASFILPHAI